jgi:vacuolar-type H+-ATPase subunit E/Vma4
MKRLSDAENRREALEALRDRLANEIDNCTSTRDLPALSKQYREVLAELDRDGTEEEESAADRIKRLYAVND